MANSDCDVKAVNDPFMDLAYSWLGHPATPLPRHPAPLGESGRHLVVNGKDVQIFHDSPDTAQNEEWIMRNAGDFECPKDLMLTDEGEDDVDEDTQAFLRKFTAEVEAAYAVSKVKHREVDVAPYELLFGGGNGEALQRSPRLASALAGAAGRALRRHAGPASGPGP